MKCPFCGSVDTQVIDSRVSEPGDSIRRRLRCVACQKRFTTYETVELRLPQVVKSNGTRADFSADRIRVGFQRALHKRPVPTEYVDAAIDRDSIAAVTAEDPGTVDVLADVDRAVMIVPVDLLGDDCLESILVVAARIDARQHAIRCAQAFGDAAAVADVRDRYLVEAAGREVTAGKRAHARTNDGVGR